MEPPVLGVVLDSSVLVRAERSQVSTPETIQNVRDLVGDVPIVICWMTVAEIAHGIYRADTPERSQMRRQFVEELKTHVPIQPLTVETADIIARLGAEQAAKGINLPLADLIIGACALELGYAVLTHNVRHFQKVPGLRVLSS